MSRLPMTITMTITRRSTSRAARRATAAALALFWLLLCALPGLGVREAEAAVPGVGSVISAAAYVTYDDAAGQTQSLQSNRVTLVVMAVSAFVLAASQAKAVPPGASFSFSFSFTNTGNTAMRADFSVGTVAPTLTGLALYPDKDCDGLADRGEPAWAALSPGGFQGAPSPIGPGQTLCLAVTGTLAGNADPATSADFSLTARGNADAARQGGYAAAAATAVTGTVQASAGAAIEMLRSLSLSSGPSPARSLRVTLSYTNRGTAARDLTIADVVGADSLAHPLPGLLGLGAPDLPFNTTGMRYVAGSATWSGKRAALTDTPDGSEDGGIEFHYDPVARTLSATIASVPAGASGVLSYLVDIAAGLPAGNATTTGRTAYRYADAADAAGTGRPRFGGTGATPYVVEAAASDAVDLKISGSAPASTPAAYPASLRFQVSNAGGAPTVGPVTVRVSLPAGMSYAGLDNASRPEWFCSGSLPTAAGQEVVCINEATLAAASLARPLIVLARPDATVLAPLPRALTVGAAVSGGAEPPANDNAGNRAAVSTMVEATASVAGRAWIEVNGDGRYTPGVDTPIGGWQALICPYDPAEDSAPGFSTNIIDDPVRGWMQVAQGPRPSVKDCAIAAVAGDAGATLGPDGKPVPPVLTASDGSFTFSTLRTGSYKLQFRDPATGQISAGGANHSAELGNNGFLHWSGRYLVIRLGAGQQAESQNLALDPSGIVYDAVTRQPVAGARVQLLGPPGFDPARHLIGGAAVADQTTTVRGMPTDGMYQFVLTGDFPDGVYRLQVTAPGGYAGGSVSRIYPPAPGVLDPPAPPCTMVGGRCSVDPRPESTPPPPRAVPLYFLAMHLSPTHPVEVVRNHIPLDPVSATAAGLVVSKLSALPSVEVGDNVDYTVTVRNAAGIAFGDVTLTDRMPFGFSFVAGSARLDGQPITGTMRGPGEIVYAIGTMVPDAQHTLTYRLHAEAPALRGDGINRAYAGNGSVSSNLASAHVKVTGGVFDDKAFLVGKVFADCNGNGMQDPGEAGVPGVRLLLEDGSFAITDGDGKYSLYGLTPRAHVLRLDPLTLPNGTAARATDNRNQRPESRFVDPRKGELARGDFAITCTPELASQIAARRQAMGSTGTVLGAESANAMNRRLPSAPQLYTPVDPKTQPASGMIAGTGNPAAPIASPAAQAFAPIAAAAGGLGAGGLGAALDAGNSNLPLPAAPLTTIKTSLAAPPLESVLPGLADNSLAILDHHDGDTLPLAQMNLRAKGVAGQPFVLRINGAVVSDARVGKQSVLAERALQAWEWIGLDLRPGENQIEVEQGGQRVAIKLIAPAKLGRLAIKQLTDARADGKTPVRFRITLSDDAGVPVTTRTPLTVETRAGRVLDTDLNPREPGVQVFIEGGSAEISVTPPLTPGDDLLRVSSGVIRAEQRVVYLPELRPMIGAGLVEGALNLRSLDIGRLRPATERDSFEQEIRSFTRCSGDERTCTGARTALFFKGAVKGDYLLTLAYDSDKTVRDRLFRDIDPDSYYPIYGDNSVKGFDAQSSERLYLRVDKGSSYVMFGDINTASNHPARQLSAYNRTLTGVKAHYESARVAANVFGARDNLTQLVEELPANGTSGPYVLRKLGGGTVITERVEILTRDRSQPAVILQTLPQTRLSDYSIEFDTGRILFKAPVASVDANYNPLSVRVTYEVDSGGERYNLAGADVQARISDRVEVGAMAVRDENPAAPMRMTGANATVKLAEGTHVLAEVARTAREVGTGSGGPDSTVGSGNAMRVELVSHTDKLDARAFATRSDPQFDNPSATVTMGRAEGGGKATYAVNDTTRATAEALYTEDRLSGAARQGAMVGVQTTVVKGVSVDAGVRHSHDRAGAGVTAPATVAAVPSADITSARLRVSAQVPQLPTVSTFVQAETGLAGSTGTNAGIGGDWRFSDKARFYAQHDFTHGISSPWALNAAVQSNSTTLGVETTVLPGTQTFSEYRVLDSLSGREAQAAVGLRNTYEVARGIKLLSSLERLRAIGSQGPESMAVALGVEYTALDWLKASTRIEARHADTQTGNLFTAAAAVRLSPELSELSRLIVDRTLNAGAGTISRLRAQTGVAWRDVRTDRMSALGRVEYRKEYDSTGMSGAIDHAAWIVSGHMNLRATRKLVYTGRLAVKYATDESFGVSSAGAATLASARALIDLTERIDVGFAASMYRSAAQTQYGVGFEMGYAVTPDLWLSVGYNVFGIRDRDFADLQALDRGFYVRLRWKFDESLFSSSRSAPSQPLMPPAGHVGGQAGAPASAQVGAQVGAQ